MLLLLVMLIPRNEVGGIIGMHFVRLSVSLSVLVSIWNLWAFILHEIES